MGTLPYLLFHVARDEATTNQWVRAEATYDEAIRLARETGQDTELAMCLAGLAWLAPGWVARSSAAPWSPRRCRSAGPGTSTPG